MSFQSKDLSVLSYANGFTLWHYCSKDAVADVDAGYFNDASDMIRRGDLLFCNFSYGASSPEFVMLVCADNTGGHLTMVQPPMVNQPVPVAADTGAGQ
tara:strand:- start:1282 stop:1575 length:294 start_codon:yes stop_codon:yes gene_type:complete